MANTPEETLANILVTHNKLLDEYERVKVQKDAAYRERNQLVALLAGLAKSELPGWHAWLGKHEEDSLWDPEWMNIVFIETPAGQLSWHIHDSEMQFFTGLHPTLYKKWDGHTLDVKYARIMYLVGLMLGRG